MAHPISRVCRTLLRRTLFYSNIRSTSTGSGSTDKPESQNVCIKMRGIPYKCTEEELIKFFSPLQPTKVQILKYPDGLVTGVAEAYFSSTTEANEALLYDRRSIGHRYIELYSEDKDVEQPANRTRYCVKMKGLPFNCRISHIVTFFSPLVPVYVELEASKRGKRNGYGFAYFNTQKEANKALDYHLNYIGSRYIELILRETGDQPEDSVAS